MECQQRGWTTSRFSCMECRSIQRRKRKKMILPRTRSLPLPPPSCTFSLSLALSVFLSFFWHLPLSFFLPLSFTLFRSLYLSFSLCFLYLPLSLSLGENTPHVKVVSELGVLKERIYTYLHLCIYYIYRTRYTV